ncbi:MAG: beta-galactosidase [Bacteroidaceae bacterium]
MKRKLLLTFVLLSTLLLSVKAIEQIDLSGMWRFQLDPMGFGKTAGSELYLKRLTETIMLPGSMDQAGKGLKNDVKHIDRLSRKFEYCGQAWYQREVVIPKEWKNKAITLSLERCHWETAVYVDNSPVAVDERLSTPNRFHLTKQLTPGTHVITLCINNQLKYPMDQWNHGTTEYTQTNWNGVVGKIKLEAKPRTHITSMNIFPHIKNGTVNVKLVTTADSLSFGTAINLTLRNQEGTIIGTTKSQIKSDGKAEATLSIGKKVSLWDEFNPYLYRMEACLETREGKDLKTQSFGMREVEQGVNHIRINGHNVHLRGTLECAVFPLTGYPATDVESWVKIMKTLKNYGMNHIRFHSWCPPKAAFEAADQIGIYIQAELPMWIKDVGKYPARRTFFEKEMYAILNEYGNHPSFILMCNGNENQGDFSVLEDLVKKAQAYDTRRLYSASTARTHVASDQYYVSHVTKKGGITVYEGWPSTDWDQSKTSGIDVPTIAHESGQRCMYPDFDEIKEYTGVLEPRNFEVFKERLTRNGMLHQAKDFLRATGAHTILQYKEVNEALLRTPNSGGFQLLGLTDFPGQGSAFVGVLNAFWKSKGIVSPKTYRESCAPTVALARFSKRVFSQTETFKAKIGLYHYGQKTIKKGHLRWQLRAEDGKTMLKGTMPHRAVESYRVDSIGTLSIALKSLQKAGRYTLHVSIADTVSNEWNIWVYPENQSSESSAYEVVDKWDEDTKKKLSNGKKVLLLTQNLPGRKTHYASHFWNPIMFNWNPMIVGTLINHEHPVFTNFPTSYYADWQWYDILNNATAIDLTDLRNITPLIQSIDSYETNRKLGISFEASVSKGKLFVLAVNPTKNIENRPASKQLILAVKKYVASTKFNPTSVLEPYELDAIISKSNEKVKHESEAIKLLFNK